MTERMTRESRAVSAASPGELLVPIESPFRDHHRRSASLAPSFRSHVTTVEEKDDIAEFRGVNRQQTFMIERKPSLWDWVKGAFNREAFMRKLEDSVRPVQTGTSPKMFTESNFIVDVLVSPKVNSSKYHNTRCLLDTGCLSGNLVSRELVESLGYVESDFQQPTPLESNGGQTLTGEQFNIEAVVLLSWHHSASPVIFRKMRFLVVSSSRFEMILGSDTITRHSLLLPPCFQAGGNGVVNERAEDEKLLDPKIKHGKMLSKIENDKKFLEDQHKKKESQRDKSEIERCEGRLPQQQHELKVLEHELAAAKFKSKGKTSEARREEQLAQHEKYAWNAAQAPKKSTCSAPVAAVDGKKVSARPPTKRGSGHSK